MAKLIFEPNHFPGEPEKTEFFFCVYNSGSQAFYIDEVIIKSVSGGHVLDAAMKIPSKEVFPHRRWCHGLTKVRLEERMKHHNLTFPLEVEVSFETVGSQIFKSKFTLEWPDTRKFIVK